MMMMGKRACLVNAVWAGEQWRQPVTLACSSEGGRLSLGGLASRRSARALASDGGPRGGQLGRRVNVLFGGCEAQGCVRRPGKHVEQGPGEHTCVVASAKHGEKQLLNSESHSALYSERKE